MKGVFKLCKASVTALANAIGTAVGDAFTNALANADITVKTTTVTKNEVCVAADGYQGLAYVVDVYNDEGVLVSTNTYALSDSDQTTPLVNVVVDDECCVDEGP